MIWKYGHCVARCHCNDNREGKVVNFTTLAPMNKEVNQDTNNTIEKIGSLLRNIGFEFWGCSVMLLNHRHIEKSDIIRQLNKYDIFSERII